MCCDDCSTAAAGSNYVQVSLQHTAGAEEGEEMKHWRPLLQVLFPGFVVTNKEAARARVLLLCVSGYLSLASFQLFKGSWVNHERDNVPLTHYSRVAA